MIYGRIFGIQRSSFQDGPGMRTVIFLSGCGMRCFWCHNPEGLTQKKQLLFYDSRCVQCGKCVEVCRNNVHSITDGKHFLDRKKCTACSACVENCMYSALEMSSREISADDVMEMLLKDKPFFSGGGGLTLSGGEPLLQSDFVLEICKRCREEGISTLVETALNVDVSVIDKIMPYTDHFFIDLKHIREEEHIKGTGVSLKPIMENIKYLNKKRTFVLRIPVIPNFNEMYLKEMADFVNTLFNVEYVQLMPFHIYGISKYNALGINYKAKDLKEPDKEYLRENYAPLFDKQVKI